MNRKRVTIEDIVKDTGYSRSTVSRVLTNKGYVDLEKRKQILQSMERLHYIPQKSHNTSINDMIMVIACQLYSEAQLLLVEGIVSTLEKEHMKVAVVSVDFENEMIYDYLQYAYDKKFGGIITLGVLDTDRLHKTLKQIQCPVVMLNQYIKAINNPRVEMNNYQGGYTAAEYLLKKGHRRIAYLTGYANAEATVDRERGFCDAMADYGIYYDDIDIIYKDFDIASGEQFAEEMVENAMPYTAVICGSDMLSMGVSRRLKQKGIAIPEEFSIVGFGDSTYSQVCTPALTVIRYDFKGMGTALANQLILAVKHPLLQQEVIVFEPEMIERESVKELKTEL